MRTRPYITVRCNGCGKSQDIDTTMPNSRKTDYELESLGWYTSVYLDLCPSCKQDVDDEIPNPEYDGGQ